MRTPLLLLLPFLFFITASCTYQQDIIKIGAILPLTGERADDAAAAKNGIDLAVLEVNQRNTVNAPIRVIYEDSRCNAKEAANAAVKLVLADGVRAIIGDICGEASIAVSKVAKSNTAVLLNLAPNITENDYTIFIRGTGSQVFMKLYERVYNETPASYASQGYDAVKILTSALEEVDYTGVKLKEALQGIK